MKNTWMRDQVLDLIKLFENRRDVEAYRRLAAMHFPAQIEAPLRHAASFGFWVSICDILEYSFLPMLEQNDFALEVLK